jgi:hypothetical protein
MSSREYQAEFDARVKEGYRLRQVSGYAVGSDAQFAAIFDKRTGPAWIARHDMTSNAYQAEFDARVREGYRLRQVSGYAVGGQARYAAIFEKASGSAWVSYHGMTPAGYQAQFDKLVNDGFRLDWVTGYVVGATPLYAAIWSHPGVAGVKTDNLLQNGDFNQPGGQATLMVITPNPPGTSGTTPQASRRQRCCRARGVPRARARCCRSAPTQDSGLRQFFSPLLDSGPAKTKSSVWVYVLSGRSAWARATWAPPATTTPSARRPVRGSCSKRRTASRPRTCSSCTRSKPAPASSWTTQR